MVKVKLKLPSRWRFPDSHTPSKLVAVCRFVPRFSQVTVLPTGTVTCVGLKRLSSIGTGVPPVEEEGAAAGDAWGVGVGAGVWAP